MHIANVQFYFYICFGDVWHLLMMVSLYSLPDPMVFSDSSKMVYQQSAVMLRFTCADYDTIMVPGSEQSHGATDWFMLIYDDVLLTETKC